MVRPMLDRVLFVWLKFNIDKVTGTQGAICMVLVCVLSLRHEN